MILDFEFKEETQTYVCEIETNEVGTILLNCNEEGTIKIYSYIESVKPVLLVEEKTTDKNYVAAFNLQDVILRIESTAEVVSGEYTGDGSLMGQVFVRAYFTIINGNESLNWTYYNFNLKDTPKGYFMMWALSPQEYSLLDTIEIRLFENTEGLTALINTFTKEQLIALSGIKLITNQSDANGLYGVSVGDYLILIFYLVAFEAAFGGTTDWSVHVAYDNKIYSYYGEDFAKHLNQS